MKFWWKRITSNGQWFGSIVRFQGKQGFVKAVQRKVDELTNKKEGFLGRLFIDAKEVRSYSGKYRYNATLPNGEEVVFEGEDVAR